MTRKVHLVFGTKGTTACAARGADANGKVIRNARATYQRMGAVAVGPDEFRATPAADRCAHCCDRFTDVMNSRRAKAGLPLYADAMTKTIQAGQAT